MATLPQIRSERLPNSERDIRVAGARDLDATG